MLLFLRGQSRNQGVFRQGLGVLDQLWLRLGPDAFVVADHWDQDPCAVGIASPENIGVLVYISFEEDQPGRYYVELELPTAKGSDFPYQVLDRRDGVDIEVLTQLTAEHLARAVSYTVESDSENSQP